VLVKVLFNPGTGNLSLVDSDVETVRGRRGAQDCEGGLDEAAHLPDLSLGEFVIIRNVTIWAD
jgi:hypothetical protein